MPPDHFSNKAKRHIEEAWRDYCLYERLLEQESSWALVLMFYSLVHLVQAHAEHLSSTNQRIIPPGDHKQRREYISNRLGRIVSDYREMQTASENVRYQMVRYSREDVLDFHSKEFARTIEDLDKKGVSWQTRLTEVERNKIFNEVDNKENK